MAQRRGAQWRSQAVRQLNKDRFWYRAEVNGKSRYYRACFQARCSKRVLVRVGFYPLAEGKVAILDSSNSITVRDLASSITWQAYSGSATPQDVQLSKDGRWVGWTYYGGEPTPSDRIMVRGVNSPAAAVNVLSTHAGTFSFIDSFDFSPAGDQVAFVANAQGVTQSHLYVINLDGTGLRQVAARTGCEDNCGRTLWSPVGDLIASVNWDDEFEVHNLATGQETVIPEGPLGRFFGWSPEQQMMAFASSPFEGPSRLRLRDTGTGRTTTLPAVDVRSDENAVFVGSTVVWETESRGLRAMLYSSSGEAANLSVEGTKRFSRHGIAFDYAG